MLSSFARRSFDSEVVGTSYEQLVVAVREHSAWVTANVDNQLAYYTTYLTQCSQALPQQGQQQASTAAQQPVNTASSTNSTASMQQQQQQQAAAGPSSQMIRSGGTADSSSSSSDSGLAASNSGSSSSSQDDEAESDSQQPSSSTLGEAAEALAKPGAALQAGVPPPGKTPLQAVQEFPLKAASLLLEEEIREAFLGTAGTAAGA